MSSSYKQDGGCRIVKPACLLRLVIIILGFLHDCSDKGSPYDKCSNDSFSDNEPVLQKLHLSNNKRAFFNI